MLRDSGALLLAVSDRFRVLATAALAEGPHAVRQVIVTGDANPLGDIPAATIDVLLAAPGRTPDPMIRAEDVCLIMYASGTTGRPKGALLTHGNMQWNAINLVTVGTGLSGSTTTLAVAPMFHIGALGISVLPTLYAGGTVVTVPAFEPV